jgi:hypothetical protein
LQADAGKIDLYVNSITQCDKTAYKGHGRTIVLM